VGIRYLHGGNAGPQQANLLAQQIGSTGAVQRQVGGYHKRLPGNCFFESDQSRALQSGTTVRISFSSAVSECYGCFRGQEKW
jgi:hypothetical protein